MNGPSLAVGGPHPADRVAVEPDRSIGPWIVLAIIGSLTAVVLTALVATKTVLPFDQPLLDLGRSWDRLTDVWRLLSDAANLPLIAIGVGLVLWLFLKRRRHEAVMVIVALALVTAGSEAVKQLVARPRPPGSDTVVPGVVYSFPSGHVLEAVTIFGIIALLIWRSRLPGWFRAGFAIAVAIFVTLVGIARVSLNAHYPSDVLAGLAAGLAVVAVMAILTRNEPTTSEPSRPPRPTDRPSRPPARGTDP
jgi:undecaprenyl-diphosphatase